jgi:hypothetical protein
MRGGTLARTRARPHTQACRGMAGVPCTGRTDVRAAQDFSAPMRNAILGFAAAAVVALVASGARIFGIDAWKIVLALVGLALFRSAARDSRKPAP